MIVINRASSAASSSARKGQFVSPSSSSLAIVINGGPPSYADVSTTSPFCTLVGTTQTCTIPIAAPAGADTVGLSFYDGPSGTGNLLGSGSGSTTVTLGQPFTVTIPISAVVASVAFAVTPNTLVGPIASTATLTLIAKDADGNTITGTAPYSAPITVTNNDTTGAIALSSTTFSKPADSITVSYTGAAATTSTTFTTAGVTAVTPAVLAIRPPHQSLFVSDTSGILVFAPGANGNAAPIRAITGANTGLSNAHGVALDAAGNIYVANYNNTITVYAPGANGNATPIRTITGSATGLSATNEPWGIALDAAGDVYVMVYNPATFANGALDEFAAGANGNVAPIAIVQGSNTNTNDANSVVLDAAGNIYVADTSPGNIYQYAPGANGNAPPVNAIAGSNTTITNQVLMQAAFDASGRLWVADLGTTGSILTFAPNVNGNVTPTTVVNGTATGLTSVRGLAFDAQNNMYASNLSTPPSVVVFAPGASGNAAPIRTLTGTATLLLQPRFIAISP